MLRAAVPLNCPRSGPTAAKTAPVPLLLLSPLDKAIANIFGSSQQKFWWGVSQSAEGAKVNEGEVWHKNNRHKRGCWVLQQC